MGKRSRWLGCGLLGVLSACGSSGGGDDGPTVLISGTAVAPGGQVSSLGPVVPVLEPVVGANVFVFEIDRAGVPVGEPLARTTTDALGRFEATLTADVFVGNAIVQVTAADEPVPVGPAGGTLNSPLTGESVVLDPGSELATRKIVDQLRAVPTDDLAHFTTAESASFVSLVQTVLRNDPTLIAPTTDETVDNIDETMSPEVVTSVLDGLDDPGEAVLPTASYHFVELFSEYDADAKRSVGRGTLTIDAGAVTMTVAGTRFTRTGACGPGDCDRTFTTVAEALVDSRTGVVTAGENGFLLFTFPNDQGEPDTTLGSLTEDQNVIVFTVNTAGRIGMRVGTRDSDTVSLLTLNGDYGFASLRSEIPPDGAASGSWSGFTSAMDFGLVTFDPGVGGFGGVRDTKAMRQDVTCSGPGCALAASLVPGVPEGPAFVPFGGVYSVAPPGEAVLVEATGPVVGHVSPTGEVLVTQHLSLADRAVGLGIAARLGSGKTNADLVGSYNFTQIEDLFNGPGASVQGGARTGVVTFDGKGNLFIVGGNVGQFRGPCALGACGGDATLANYDTFESGGVYQVDSAGNVAMSVISFGPSFPLFGTLSDNGSVLVMHHRRDIAPFVSLRFFAVGTKQKQ